MSLLLSVRELVLNKTRFDLAFEPDSIDWSESKFRQKTALRISGVAELIGDSEEIRIHGHITGQLEGDCDRCLEATPFMVDNDFDLLYRPEYKDSEELDVEVDEGESEIGFYEGGGLKLADVLREQVLLWLPMQWVCKKDCKGICPVCGENRNLVSCGLPRRES